MKKFIIVGVVAVSLAAYNVKATTIAQWTFETAASTNAINTSLTPGAGNATATVPADVGTGSAVAKHAGASTYSTPAGDLDPTIAASDAGATAANVSPSIHGWSSTVWAVGDYYQFQVSTLGLTGIEVEWDQAGSNTGPGKFVLQYSLDGTSYTTTGTNTVPLSTWNTTSSQGAASFSQSFAGAVDNQGTVYFRVTDNSTTSVNGGTTASSGTDRIDNFTVIGVPEPSTVALVCAGLAGLFALRRRRA